MKILISSCLLGRKVRWNGAHKLDGELISWCEKNGIEIIPVCPEEELFGTPRAPIKLIQIGEDTHAIMGSENVYDLLEEKSKEIFSRHNDASGFIGMMGSPSCGISVGVKKAGRVTKGMMHKVSHVPTDDSGHMKNPTRREAFLKRVVNHDKG